MYFSRQLNEMVQRIPAMFPTAEHPNHGFYVVGTGSDKPFSTLATDVIPDLAFWGSSNGQFFSRYTYVADSSDDTLFASESAGGYTRVDNITNEALADYCASYGADVSKDDVFHYVYGLLHSPEYRIRFAADLKKTLPRIPKVATSDDFRAFVAAGRGLATLHIGYESVEPYPLDISGEPPSSVTGDRLFDYYCVEKMRFSGNGKAKTRSAVVYNSRITVSGIPEQAHEYMLGSRSAIEWIMERYQVKVDKASQIRDDPNDWSREVGDPRYILDLLGRIVTLSLETMRIVDALPALNVVAAQPTS
jgi:predicted helicase